LNEFEQCIEEFKWIKDCIENGEDSYQYNFDTWCDAFNEYLEQLYDIGDEITIERGWSDTEKFLWVG